MIRLDAFPWPRRRISPRRRRSLAPTALAAFCLGTLGVAALSTPAAAEGPNERFLQYFIPFSTDNAALSPDGKYLAYSIREHDKINVAILEIDQPEKVITLATVATDATSTPMMSANQYEATPARIRWMRWTTPTRLVVDTNGVTPVSGGQSWGNYVGAVFALDADGKHAGLIATPRDILEQLPGSFYYAPRDRSRNTSFWNPVRPAGVSYGGVPVDESRTPEPTDPSVSLTKFHHPMRSGTTVAQNFRIFDLAPGKPGDVLLETFGSLRQGGSRRIGFEQLDTVTGKTKELSGDLVPPNRAWLSDLSHHVRLTLPSTLLTSFPHVVQYLGPTGDSFAHPLNRLSRSGDEFSVSPENYFGRRSIPIGFGADPNLLYFASNIGRDTFGVYSLDLRTGRRTGPAFEDPHYDLAPPAESFASRHELVIDRFTGAVAGIRYPGKFARTLWLSPAFQDVERLIEQALPNHSIRILDWDKDARRFLVLADAPGDAGAYYVFEPASRRLFEFVRRAPWIDDGHTNKTYPFSFDEKGGFTVHGMLVVPNQPRVTPMPVVVLCPSVPWDRMSPDFQSRAQALAEMGYLVVEYNGRGAWGFGLRERAALAPGYDLTQVEDLMATVDYVVANERVDPKRIAVMGESHGGFIALRAVQMHPNRLRCAIAMNAPIDLGDWLATQRWTNNDIGPSLQKSALGDEARFKEAPLARHPELIKRPLMLLHYPGRDGGHRAYDYLAAKSFASTVRGKGDAVEFHDLSMDYMRGLPLAHTKVYEQIDTFLNSAMFDYSVNLGRVRERQ